MEIRQLRYFVAVCDLGSFTEAAGQNGVTQPALSQSIRELERMVGQKLLARESRASRPTEAGTALLGFARVIVRQHDQAKAEMDRLRGERTGTIRLGLHSAFPRSVIVRATEALQHRHAGVTVHINSAAIDAPMLIRKLNSVAWDLAVTAYETDGDLFLKGKLRADLQLTRLSGTSSVVCASAAHPLHRNNRITAEDLCAYPWTFASPRAAELVGQLIADNGGTEPIRIDMQSDTFPGMLQAVAQTNMLCIAPVSLIEECGLAVQALNQKIIQPYPINWGVFIHPDAELTRPARYLMERINEENRSPRG